MERGELADTPLVSVIIPVFNRPGPVLRAIASALDQDYPRLEVVVCDDGSTDDTWRSLTDIADPRLKLIRQASRGVAAARNAAIGAARGDVFALLDSDDYFLPGKIARQTAFMRERGYEISQTGEIWMRRGVRVNPGHRHAKPSGRIFAQSLKLCLVSPSCAMFTRRFLKVVGLFDETLPACEDYDLWLRASLRFEVGLLPENLTVKQGGSPDQLSRKIIGLDLYRLYALMKILKMSDLCGEERRLARAELGEKTRIYCRGCLLHGKDEEARRIAALTAEHLERT